MRWVGVFVDDEPERVVRAARALELDAVQLHGSESGAYLDALRPLLPERCAVWKAARVGKPEVALPSSARAAGADRWVFDAYRPDEVGGTGTSFDWSLVRSRQDRKELIVSGGIGVDNAAEADALDVWALDSSSRLECRPGRKDEAKLEAFFSQLRGSRARGPVLATERR
jgi:indole-3-glycerol phosphate synthase/phosphoribosylanthranilate isomerase